MKFHFVVALLLGLTTGVLADGPLCRTGKCEDGCDCGPRIKDCGCFRVAGADQCIDTSFKPKGKGPPVTVDDRVKKPVEKKTVMKTLCLCSKTGKCVCWADECNCPECAKTRKATPEVVASPDPFGLGSSPWRGTVVTSPSPDRPTTVQSAAGQPYRTGTVDFLNSGPAQYGAPIYTLTAPTGGSTSGCANGQCGTVQRRGLFFR